MAIMVTTIPAAPVGASVHYVNPAGLCRAATVTETGADGHRDLKIHHPGEIAHRRTVPYGPDAAHDTWHSFDASVEPGCI